MQKHVCLHGHFYQPPRENPWLEEVEVQESATPFHDWNARINHECYEANAWSRILDDEGRIERIVNNYAKISFNFGPTLLSWMDRHAPPIMEALQRADAESQSRFGGHGSAMAQAHGHIIMPLANLRDKQTQIHWGIEDFKHRFGRHPEGMWLPETAVDLQTLDLMAEAEIKFVLLAPRQARAVRKIGETKWRQVSEENLDTTQPYQCNLPSGRKIALFFYHGALSQELAFGPLLDDGQAYAQRLLDGFPAADEKGNDSAETETDAPRTAQILPVATDGETYGHHHRFGDMALAYALNHLEQQGQAHLTVFGAYLEDHPPTAEAQIHENSSWSCIHGVERWRSDCGCKTGGKPEWHQKWRGPLREAMNWLRDHLADVFERQGRALFDDPWQARRDYLSVILDRSAARPFLAQHGARELTHGDKVRALKLLEMQRHGFSMFASCGWFFDEISGIEPVQVMSHAARAMQLASEVDGADPEPGFLKILEKAPSNLEAFENGRQVYEQRVQPLKADLLKIGSCHVAELLFSDTPPSETPFHCYHIQTENIEKLESGRLTFCSGKTRICSTITLEESELVFAALNLGDHNVAIGIGPIEALKQANRTTEPARNAFLEADVMGALRQMQLLFGERIYDLSDLFEESRRRVQTRLLDGAQESLESCLRPIFKEYSHTLQAVRKGQSPLPKVLGAAWELLLDADLQRALDRTPIDAVELDLLGEQAERWAIKWDRENLSPAATAAVDRMAEALKQDPHSVVKVQHLLTGLRALERLALKPDLWTSQNVVYDILHGPLLSQQRKNADQGDHDAQKWLKKMKTLAKHIRIRTAWTKANHPTATTLETAETTTAEKPQTANNKERTDEP
jgi:alpha-amylase/alpha-mannosidase (GH57 family)